jgi:hypothetical protein
MVCLLTACEKMDDTYSEYIVPRGITYPGKAISPIVYSGYNRALVEWNTGNDPKVVKTVIFWNNYTDSIVANVPAGQAVVSKMIEPLEENDYTFIIRTYDEKGNRSVPSEVTGSVYGDGFMSRLTNRALTAIETDGGKTTISWGARVTYGLWSELYYVNLNGEEIVKKIAMNETATELLDYQSDLRSRTMCLPSAVAIDTIGTPIETQFVLSSTPFNGPHILSAESPCEIQARDFDYGGEGLAFHEVSNRTPNSSYRTDAGDQLSKTVDIEAGGNLGYVGVGEWLVYTVEVRDAGVYAADALLSVNGSSGGSFSFAVDGNGSETTTAPNQGSWSAWIYVFEVHPEFTQPTFRLSAGKHKIRFNVDGGAFNLMGYKFTYIGG